MKFVLRFTRVGVLAAKVYLTPSSLHAQASDRRATIEWLSESNDALTMSGASRFAVDREGRLFVPEASESVVYVFGADGRFIGRVGAKGGGPGEFAGNCCAAIDPKGRLWVRDVGGMRYVVFDLTPNAKPRLAKPAFTVRMAHPDVNLWQPLFFDNNGRLYDAGHRATENGSFGISLVRLLTDTSGRVVGTERLRQRTADVDAPFRITVSKGDRTRQVTTTSTYYQPLGSQALRALGPNGSYAIAASGKYEIEWYGTGSVLLRTIRGAAVAPKLTEKESEAVQIEIEEIARETGRSVGSLPFRVPQTKPVLRDMQFDLEGRLWVERNQTSGAPRVSDVYSPDGTRLFSVTWPPVPKMTFHGAARGRSAWVTTQDEDDIPRVVKVRY